MRSRPLPTLPRAWIAPVFALLAACFPEGAPRTLAFATDHFRYYSDAPACPTLGAWMEADYAATHTFLGLDAPRSDRIRYFYYGDDAELPAVCGGERNCYVGGDVLSSEVLERTPVVRAVTDDLGDPPFFFEYGLAALLGTDTAGDDVWVDHSEDVAAMLRGEVPFSEVTAAFFTRALLDRHGTDAFLDFYASADRSGDPSAQFAEAFEPVAAAVAAWADAPDARRGDLYLRLPECASERIQLPASGPITLEPALTCAEVPLDWNAFPGKVGRYATVEVREGEALHLAVRDGARTGAGVELIGCDGYAEGVQGVWVNEAEAEAAEIWTQVDPGLYFLDLIEYAEPGAATGSGATWLEIERGPWPMGDRCEAAGQVALVSGRLTRLEGPSGDGQLAVWLTATEALDLELGPTGAHNFEPSLTATSASLCTGACGALSCDPVPLTWFIGVSGRLALAADQPALLVLEFPAGSHAWVDLRVL